MTANPKGFVVFNHQGKGDAYVNALRNAGYKELAKNPNLKRLPIILTDSDILGRKVHLDRYHRGGAKAVFVIPHTARPNIVNDVVDGWEHTTAQFVAARGHIDVMRAYGYDKPIHATGWTLCPLKRFKPAKTKKPRVLFGPIHPRCSEIDKQVNRETFERLFKLAKQDAITLTVRFIRSLKDSGLDTVKHPNVHYTNGWMNQAYDEIDIHDLIVGHQTFAWLGVARGKPTLMMAERTLKTHIEPRRRPILYARHWDSYVDLLAYPLDILEEEDTWGLIQRACQSDDEIKDWRRRMIGSEFRPKSFIEFVQKYI